MSFSVDDQSRIFGFCKNVYEFSIALRKQKSKYISVREVTINIQTMLNACSKDLASWFMIDHKQTQKYNTYAPLI